MNTKKLYFSESLVNGSISQPFLNFYDNYFVSKSVYMNEEYSFVFSSTKEEKTYILKFNSCENLICDYSKFSDLGANQLFFESISFLSDVAYDHNVSQEEQVYMYELIESDKKVRFSTDIFDVLKCKSLFIKILTKNGITFYFKTSDISFSEIL